MDLALLKGLGLALGLGLLVGFQRERARASLAGIRTFALISLIGGVGAHVGGALGVPWLLPAALLGLAALLVSGHVARSRTEPPELTTEVAAVLMVLVGAMAVAGPRLLAVSTGAVMALLLHFKEPMHGTVQALADEEVRGVMSFVLIALVVLPLLPDRAFDPMGVLNPHSIWLMVVLIVGLSLVAHGAFRMFGRSKGAVVAGVLGGLISSTATTVQQARRSKGAPDLAIVGATVAILASATALLRVLVEIALTGRELLALILVPMLLVFATLVAAGLVLLVRSRGSEASAPESHDPAQLRTALLFGALYALVILAVAFSQRSFGSSGLFVVAILSGLTDVDAITLSTAQLVREGRLAADSGWRLILVAAMSNLAFKGGIAAVLGGRRLATIVLVTFAIALALGIPLVAWWPRDWRAWAEGGIF